ncbi:hypothetical protein [Spirochaeta lutea]|uniref:Phosphagen kinase C-terminal domain-containing protein n=1 Tax=Spirochaeta lutea TaxID=1480694 RepID=A0A098QS81_9SPIO|nr:hypothetical protein [Spirochaeta lutea]KGE70735.1 hypothetical protein DC28_14635 [Spirochaeta lutea]
MTVLENQLRRPGAPGVWISGAGPESDIVISTRLRLSRNLEAYPFPGSMDPEQRRTFLSEMDIELRGMFSGMTWQPLGSPGREREWLAMLGWLPRKTGAAESLLLREEAGDAGLVVNHVDHLEPFALEPGLQIQGAFSRIKALESTLDSRFRLAANSPFGFLTTRVREAGLGMRCSLLLHLPAMSRMRGFEELLPVLRSRTLDFRIFSQDLPSGVYRLTGQALHGQKEEEFLEILADLALELVHYERRMREEWHDQGALEFDDQVWRSLGTISQSRCMTLAESLSLLSWVRMGSGMRILDVPLGRIGAAFFQTQDAVLSWMSGMPVSEGVSGADGEKPSTGRAKVTILEEERSRLLRRIFSGG